MYNFTTLFVGRSLLYLPTCHSTNAVALEMATDPKTTEGTIVLTDHQTEGRGQQHNTWEAAPHQNLTFSLILHPSFLAVAQQFWLNIAISLGIYDFLSTHILQDLKIKWPNDLYYQNHKLGGVLIQNILSQENIRRSVVGIGLNVNQTGFQTERAISIKQITGQEISLNTALEVILGFLEKRYLQLRSGNFDRLKQHYLQNLYRYQEVHTFKSQQVTFQGTILGIDKIGRLCVEKEGRLHYFSFKEIEYIT